MFHEGGENILIKRLWERIWKKRKEICAWINNLLTLQYSIKNKNWLFWFHGDFKDNMLVIYFYLSIYCFICQSLSIYPSLKCRHICPALFLLLSRLLTFCKDLYNRAPPWSPILLQSQSSVLHLLCHKSKH